MKRNVLKTTAISLAAVFAACGLGGCSLFRNAVSSVTDELISTIVEDETASSENNEMKAELAKRQAEYKGYGFQSLATDAERELYTLVDIYAGKSSGEEFSISNANGITDKINEVIETYKNDHPEVFWINDDTFYLYRTFGQNYYITLNFSMEGDELVQAREGLEGVIEQALDNAPADGTDYEKELYINDYLVESCEYLEEAENREEVIANEQNAYGALVEKTAVCEGYTRAFQLLCNRMNIDCYVINGTVEESEETVFSGNHIWNLVKLDDEWYHVDVTWNDFVPDTEEYFMTSVETHRYFNVTTDEISEDHKITPLLAENTETDYDFWCNDFIPECTATKYNYFNYSMLTLDDLDDSDELINGIREAAESGKSSYEFRIADYLDFDETVDEIVNYYMGDWLSAVIDIEEGDTMRLYTYDEKRIVALTLI